MSISSNASEIPSDAAQSAAISNPQVWNGLKLAIAESSGFERWKQDRKLDSDASLDSLVHRYLRETLETLAY